MRISLEEYEKLDREKRLALSESDRFFIGCAMFDKFRNELIASLPPGLTDIDKRKMFWERMYGTSSDFITADRFQGDFK